MGRLKGGRTHQEVQKIQGSLGSEVRERRTAASEGGGGELWWSQQAQTWISSRKGKRLKLATAKKEDHNDRFSGLGKRKTRTVVLSKLGGKRNYHSQGYFSWSKGIKEKKKHQSTRRASRSLQTRADAVKPKNTSERNKQPGEGRRCLRCKGREIFSKGEAVRAPTENFTWVRKGARRKLHSSFKVETGTVRTSRRESERWKGWERVLMTSRRYPPLPVVPRDDQSNRGGGDKRERKNTWS